MSDKTPDGTPEDDTPESSHGEYSGECSMGKLVYLSPDMDNGGMRVDKVLPAIEIGDTVYGIEVETRERGSATVGFSKKFAANWATAFGDKTEEN